MIAFLLLCLVPALLLFAVAPMALFGLMLETARERTPQAAGLQLAEREPAPPSSGRLQTQWA